MRIRREDIIIIIIIMTESEVPAKAALNIRWTRAVARDRVA